jgi:hypothetical protein
VNEALDATGQPLAVGDHVEAWWDGEAYTATVTAILPHDPECGDHRHIILERDRDNAIIQNDSDAVLVIA